LFNMADMDPTPISHTECARGNGVECGKMLKSELVVNGRFTHEYGSHDLIQGAH